MLCYLLTVALYPLSALLCDARDVLATLLVFLAFIWMERVQELSASRAPRGARGLKWARSEVVDAATESRPSRGVWKLGVAFHVGLWYISIRGSTRPLLKGLSFLGLSLVRGVASLVFLVFICLPLPVPVGAGFRLTEKECSTRTETGSYPNGLSCRIHKYYIQG